MLQVFGRKLDQLESTVSQLESASGELVNSGYLSDNDDAKQQVLDVQNCISFIVF